MAQIDSTKTHLYLNCANEILINYPKNIDTTKITFEVKGGKIYQILSKEKIVVVASWTVVNVDVYYKKKLLYNRKYTIRFLSKPRVHCVMTKNKFPSKLRIQVKSMDTDFIKDCPLDAVYTGTFTADLIKDREVVIKGLFTDKKYQLTKQEWIAIRELFKKDPNAKWRIYIEVHSTTRTDYKGEKENATCPPQFSYNYTLRSFEM